MDVDVVIAWVDGADPAHSAKRALLLGQGAATPKDDVATKARRFSDNDELRYCLRSIHNHMPWVRTVWLLTDAQSPPYIDLAEAENHRVRLVDHKDIFRGFEALLPTFNSLAIETLLWRIEGVAENFLYFNDDMVLVGPTERSDFFDDEGRMVLRGRWLDWSELEKPSFHGSNKLLGAQMANYEPSNFFSTVHAVYPMRRSIMERLFEENLPAFARNAAFRFRSREQFWPISLCHHAALASDQAVVRTADDTVHFSVRFCRDSKPEDLIARVNKVAQPSKRIACFNYMEAILKKDPTALEKISAATGAPAPFERFEA